MATALPPEIRFQPDPDARQPLYLQLTDALSDAICAGRIAVGSLLPSERLYAEQLGVSRTTVTTAYQELKARGLVRGHVGRGAVVISNDPDGAPDNAIAWPQLASRLVRVRQSSAARLQPELVSLGDGWIHPSLTPRSALAACAAKAMTNPDVLSMAAPIMGLTSLRVALAQHVRSSGVKAALEEILITGGAQQGINVVTRALVAPGDAVICETPTWHGAFKVFHAAGAKVSSVFMDREGIDPVALEDAIVRLRPKFVYLMPSYQCPTGRLMGMERRRRVLEICTRLRTPILESHVYGDLAFDQAMPSLKSMDTAGIVMHQGSVTKTVGAALRLGWLVAPDAAMNLLAPAKASLDLCTSIFAQAILAELFSSAAYARHVSQLRAALQARRDSLVAELAIHCPELRCVTPQGGLYVWAQLPKPLQAREFESIAADHGVSVRSGDAFLPDGGTSCHIRLCYGAPASNDLAVAAQRLGKALKAAIQRYKSSAVETSVAASV